MDSITKQREAVKQTILHYAKFRPSHGQIRLDPIFDEANDRYALMQVGWDGALRVKGNLIYITLHDGKIFIEYDGIERGITDELIARGIPAEQITLAFTPELAVA